MQPAGRVHAAAIDQERHVRGYADRVAYRRHLGVGRTLHRGIEDHVGQAFQVVVPAQPLGQGFRHRHNPVGVMDEFLLEVAICGNPARRDRGDAREVFVGVVDDLYKVTIDSCAVGGA